MKAFDKRIFFKGFFLWYWRSRILQFFFIKINLPFSHQRGGQNTFKSMEKHVLQYLQFRTKTKTTAQNWRFSLQNIDLVKQKICKQQNNFWMAYESTKLKISHGKSISIKMYQIYLQLLYEFCMNTVPNNSYRFWADLLIDGHV